MIRRLLMLAGAAGIVFGGMAISPPAASADPIACVHVSASSSLFGPINNNFCIPPAGSTAAANLPSMTPIQLNLQLPPLPPAMTPAAVTTPAATPTVTRPAITLPALHSAVTPSTMLPSNFMLPPNVQAVLNVTSSRINQQLQRAFNGFG